MSEDQILTIEEFAGIPKAPEKTVYSMAQDGEPPAVKFPGHWRIRRFDLEEWMKSTASAGVKSAEGPHAKRRK